MQSMRSLDDSATRAVMLHTTTFMVRAVRLYEALGYTRTPEWDLTADDRYSPREPSGLTAIAYRRELSA